MSELVIKVTTESAINKGESSYQAEKRRIAAEATDKYRILEIHLAKLLHTVQAGLMNRRTIHFFDRRSDGKNVTDITGDFTEEEAWAIFAPRYCTDPAATAEVKRFVLNGKKWTIKSETSGDFDYAVEGAQVCIRCSDGTPVVKWEDTKDHDNDPIKAEAVALVKAVLHACRPASMEDGKD